MTSTLQDVTTLLIQHQLDAYSSIPREIPLSMANAALTAFIQDMLTDPAHYFNDYWSSVAPQRADLAIKIDDIFTAIFVKMWKCSMILWPSTVAIINSFMVGGCAVVRDFSPKHARDFATICRRAQAYY
ncbi:MAG: hypothetical protein U0074_00925 [Kouleothrix sp.]